MMKKAFTMIELVMVIVVMGIVASIGADIIANLYENYIKTRAINRLQSQTELALDQIAKRLQFRIKDSVRAIDGIAPFSVPLEVPLPDANSSYTIMEWVGTSNESFLGGWSGFIDLDSNETNSTTRTIKTAGSDLNMTNSVIEALTYNTVSLDAGSKSPALILKGKSSYDINDYYNATATNYTLKIERDVAINDRFRIPNDDNITNSEIFEQYWLSHSAFAIVPNGTANDFNLTLHYNYQPWEGEAYSDVNGTVIIEHASTFRFTQIGETIRVKLCIHDNNQSGNYDFSFCKERVIY